MIWGSGGSKSRLAKAAGAEPAEGFGAVLEVEMLKKCTALWREAHLEVKSVKNCGSRSTFGS